MELKKDDPRCYTDVCVNGLWYHHDHGTTKAYLLRGGASPVVEMAKEPTTEEELIELLKAITPDH